MYVVGKIKKEVKSAEKNQNLSIQQIVIVIHTPNQFINN